MSHSNEIVKFIQEFLHSILGHNLKIAVSINRIMDIFVVNVWLYIRSNICPVDLHKWL